MSNIGTVRTYIAGKGYGWLKEAGDQRECWFHISNVRDQAGVGVASVREGDKVKFDIADSKKRPGSFTAWNIQVEKDAA